MPGQWGLPWHLFTQTGQGGLTLDRFEGGVDTYTWAIRKRDDGMDVQFTAEGPEVQKAFAAFRRALAMLLGWVPKMAALIVVEGQQRITRLHNTRWEPDDAKLLTPLRLIRPDSQNAHELLGATLRHAMREDDLSRLLYARWHRILRARENDIENSALILSVAIGGLIKDTFANEHDADAGFLALIDTAKPAVEELGLHERVKNAVFASLGNAVRPNVKNVLKRLIRQGAITNGHLVAWEDLRHAAAQGESMREESLQSHLDRYHACLNLFYRLLFLVVGYRGPHTDYSVSERPEMVFPPRAEVPIVPSGLGCLFKAKSSYG